MMSPREAQALVPAVEAIKAPAFRWLYSIGRLLVKTITFS